MAKIVSFMLCVLLLPPKKHVKKKTAFENYVYAPFKFSKNCKGDSKSKVHLTECYEVKGQSRG